MQGQGDGEAGAGGIRRSGGDPAPDPGGDPGGSGKQPAPAELLAQDLTPRRRLRRGEATLAYETRGEAGSPVLLVMGFGMPGRAWLHQIPVLCRRHRVAWFDHRGTGQTRAPAGRYTMGLLAGDALAIADDLGWGRFHLVGVSMGGMVAQHLALGHRDRLRSLCLIATHAGGRLPRTPTALGARRFIAVNTARPDQRIDALKRLLFPEAFLATANPAWLDGVLEGDFGQPVALPHRLAQLAAIRGHNTAGRLHQLCGLPTLVVKPGADILVRPEESDRLQRAIPGARLETFPEAGHGIIRQCYKPLNRLLLQHFAQADLEYNPPP